MRTIQQQFIMSEQGLSAGRYPQNSIQPTHNVAHVSKDIGKLIPSSLKLPELSRRDKYLLGCGQSIQTQQRAGGAGTGVIVLDVPASPDFVFDTLTRFQDYNKFIPTVRSVHVYSSTSTTNEAEFAVSRFFLKMNIRHTIFPDQRVIKFTLDESRTNIVLREATGLWFVHSPPDRAQGWSRVYFKADVRASRLVPGPVVDYAASKALARATNWMQPYFSQIYQQQQRLLTSSSSSTAVLRNIPKIEIVDCDLSKSSSPVSEAAVSSSSDGPSIEELMQLTEALR